MQKIELNRGTRYRIRFKRPEGETGRLVERVCVGTFIGDNALDDACIDFRPEAGTTYMEYERIISADPTDDPHQIPR